MGPQAGERAGSDRGRDLIPLDPPGLIEAPDILETERLLLRQFLETDVDLCSRIYADPEVMRYIGDGQTMTREETWRWVASALGHWVLRGYGLYAVEEKMSGTFIGRIGLYNPEGWPGLEAGWLLGRQHWGRGYATEGAKAVVRMAYESVGATHLISLIQPENEASIRVAEKLGAIRESTIDIDGRRAHIYAYGGPPVDPTLLLAPHRT